MSNGKNSPEELILEPLGNTYYLVINGKPEGPFSVEQLKGLKIRQNDFVKTAGMDDYKEAHEIEELRQLFHFKRQSVVPQYFAGFDQRLLAAVLDCLFVSGFYIVLAFAAILVVTERSDRLMIALSLLILIPISNFIYHIVMESSDRQATYGKQILKIKVCDMEGLRINTGKAINRNFCKIFCVLSLGVGYVISFFNRKQQCMHDMMAGTLVMKDRLI